jgi:hypothetical protein
MAATAPQTHYAGKKNKRRQQMALKSDRRKRRNGY